MRRSSAVGLTVLGALLLSGLGILLVYSASRRMYGMELALRQSLWLMLGLAGFGLLLTRSRRRIYRYRWLLYAGGILLLAVTLQFGVAVRGDRSWLSFFGLFNIQSSEIMKPLMILALAGVAERAHVGTLRRRTGLAIQGLVLGIPVALILLQPDVGTAMVYLAFLVGWLFVQGYGATAASLIVLGGGMGAGLFVNVVLQRPIVRWVRSIPYVDGAAVQSPLPPPYLLLLLGGLCAGFLLFPHLRGRRPTARSMLLLLVPALALGYRFSPFLAGYQRQRLEVYLNPYEAPLTGGYNIIQSQIAIGSGGWFGQGWLQGSQSQLGFIPELWTDFVFSVAVEELGLLFAGLVLGLLFLLVYSTFALATLAPDRRGYLTGTGVALIWILHTAINLGVCVGLVPVLGLPLPFVSYGGSFLVTNWLMIGLVLVVTRPRRGRVVGGRVP